MPSVRAAAGLAVLLMITPAGAAAARLPHGRPDIRPAPTALRPSAPRPAQLLADHLGRFGIVDIDPVTRTPRNLARLDGYLTAPSAGDPGDIALDYVRAHRDVFRLTEAEIGDLQPVRRYADVQGITHIIWRQWHGSLPVVGAGLRANVTGDGRIISLQGGPVADFGPVAVRRAVRPARAVAAAAAGVRVSQAAASMALAPAPGGARLVYRVTGRVGTTERFVATVDARTGEPLERRNLIKWATDAGVWDYYPSDAAGAQFSRHAEDFVARGWLSGAATTLDGPNAQVYSDVNDDNSEGAGDTIPADTSALAFSTFSGTTCSSAFPCSWNPSAALSWQANRELNGAQAFYFLNVFHDWLAAAPIGFGPGQGNFGDGDSDPVLGETLDGASTNGGVPDANHVNNSNFLTLPDGQSPTMQMYLFRAPFTNGNGGDEADIVYHEYTHGLSSRTVTDEFGFEAVDGVQAGALGEAWSDWYAMDFMVEHGFHQDAPGTPDVVVGAYVTGGSGIRSEPMDCAAADAACPGGPYTYGDLAQIDSSGPEVHADGEIWAQTLWQLRGALGAAETRELVTEGMRLTPAFPDFLDARNGIIEATFVLHPGDLPTVWDVFTSRGMGYWASTWGDDDTSPVESFDPAPDGSVPSATVRGKVVDSLSGAPVASASIAFGGHETPGATQTSLSAKSGSKGTYAIAGVPQHVYPHLFFDKSRYFGDEVDGLNVNHSPTTVRTAKLERDWAMFATSGTTFTGSDESATLGCGPGNAIDGLFGWGWVAKPKSGRQPSLTVRLPARADLYRIGIAPWAACSTLADGASVGRLKIETSADGARWHSLGDAQFTSGDLGFQVLFNPPSATRFGVRYVRITMVADQGGDPSFPGYVGMGEMTVFALPVMSVRATLTRAGSGTATLRLTCNQPCSTRVGHTAVRLSAAGTVSRRVRASGTVRLVVTASRTGRKVSRSVKVR